MKWLQADWAQVMFWAFEHPRLALAAWIAVWGALAIGLAAAGLAFGDWLKERKAGPDADDAPDAENGRLGDSAEDARDTYRSITWTEADDLALRELIEQGSDGRSL